MENQMYDPVAMLAQQRDYLMSVAQYVREDLNYLLQAEMTSMEAQGEINDLIHMMNELESCIYYSQGNFSASRLSNAPQYAGVLKHYSYLKEVYAYSEGQLGWIVANFQISLAPDALNQLTHLRQLLANLNYQLSMNEQLPTNAHNTTGITPLTDDIANIFGAEEEVESVEIELEEVTGFKKFLRVGFNFLFYGLLAAGVVIVILTSGGSRAQEPTDVFGFSFMTILTSSMVPELPVRSLVVMQRREPHEFQINDIATYLRGNNTTVTHRIIDIIENYDGEGGLGFQLKGDNNAFPDSVIVREDQMLGVIVFDNLLLGNMLSFIQHSPWLSAALAVLLLLLMTTLRSFFDQRKALKKVTLARMSSQHYEPEFS